ncbi:PREDICTED: E3 ubiquitin-protein ligase mib1-like [Wasmannia auropunctata]|uniref:E3 ubiquitin-protein ligase mib1-like n=1 Tax=Wasmannia auropunctata TaxID=64793 RepID=UPI0005ED72BF|nr:PREDICTED: E3 ubiquitin-protein ligase mib1-like [Wasmannia auropunctata]
MQVRNNKDKIPFDLLEDKQQIALLAYFLGFYKDPSYSKQLGIENSLSIGYVEPSTYQIDNISESEGLHGAKKNVDSDDVAEYRDCSGIVADTKQEDQIDPSNSTTLVGCGHTVIDTQTVQDGQLTADEISNPDKSKDILLKGKWKKKISDSEKEKNEDIEPLTLQMLRYLGTKITDFEKEIICNICVERRRIVVFLCGHGACEHCTALLKICHICHKTITKKINLY